MSKLLELAARCEKNAIVKLEAYFNTGNQKSDWNGDDRLSGAEHLLACAVALRARASLDIDVGEGKK